MTRAVDVAGKVSAACGWLVQSRDEMNLSAGTGVAVREFATGSGPVDYALFVDKRFCGVVEAKPAGTTLSVFSEQAAARSRFEGPYKSLQHQAQDWGSLTVKGG
jgi:type I restriction enzyme R subunit